MRFICVDTNVYLNGILDRGKESFGKIINDIYELIDNKPNVKVLLPDIIKKEFYRNYENQMSSIKHDLKNIRNRIKCTSYPMQISENKNKIIEDMNEAIDKFQDVDFYATKNIVKQIFNHRNTIVIKSNSKILSKTYKRSLFRKMPNGEDFLSGDNLIVECLKWFSDNNNIGQIDLLTRNYKDFGTSKNNKNVVHPSLKSEFDKYKINYVYKIERYMHQLDLSKEVTELPDYEENQIICLRCGYTSEKEWGNKCPNCGAMTGQLVKSNY